MSIVGTCVLLVPITGMGTLWVSTYIHCVSYGYGHCVLLVPITRMGTLCISTHVGTLCVVSTHHRNGTR